MKYRIEFDYELHFGQTVEADDLETAVYTVMKTASMNGKGNVIPKSGTIYIKKLDE